MKGGKTALAVQPGKTCRPALRIVPEYGATQRANAHAAHARRKPVHGLARRLLF